MSDAPFRPADAPQRVLLGPGPSDVAPAVLRALASPTLGHLDPRTLEIMAELAAMLRTIFGTRNEWTLAVSGTGTSGMEACLVN
jgi:alanine-glyoxylate transaminase/serine-glyoxylate transaminase/serine-pyruvate transaminase